MRRHARAISRHFRLHLITVINGKKFSTNKKYTQVVDDDDQDTTREKNFHVKSERILKFLSVSCNKKHLKSSSGCALIACKVNN
jgi:hypothetical protein